MVDVIIVMVVVMNEMTVMVIVMVEVMMVTVMVVLALIITVMLVFGKDYLLSVVIVEAINGNAVCLVAVLPCYLMDVLILKYTREE